MFNAGIYLTGIFLVNNQGEQYNIDDWKKLGYTSNDVVGIRISTDILVANNSTYIIPIKVLFKLDKRDTYGLIGWFIVSSIINILSLPIMVSREIYQWKHYNLSRFELEDVIRYSLIIILGSIINYCLLRWII